jgi:adenine-specific DNA-methyltransferase
MTRRVSEAMRKLGRGAPIGDIQDFFPQILSGGDPLGDFFVESVSAGDRRIHGATFTPPWLIDLQLDQIAAKCSPARVIDAGAGTGRYAVRAAQRWPHAEIIAVEKDPLLADAILINARAVGLKIQVLCADYLSTGLPQIDGVTAFVGNPPYVRHHDIPLEKKEWYSTQMAKLGLPHSQLAGLHIYFYLKSYLLSRPGDVGSFVTAAEWTETNYGESMRTLFCLMGGDILVRVHPNERIFHDALTTSVIATWLSGNDGNVSVCDLIARSIELRFRATRKQLLSLAKWPGYGHSLPPAVKSGLSLLGDSFQVNRGQVTGCNELWIATKETEKLIPERYLFPCVTDAMEIIKAQGILNDLSKLRGVIDLPADLGELSKSEREKVDSFLEIARFVGATDSYIAQHRKPWWRVGLKPPPAIVMSYMGRRPPRFARNACGARLINIAHGLTPRRPMTVSMQDKIVAWLNANVAVSTGRTYGGGMIKFEPSDAMNIPLPAVASAF